MVTAPTNAPALGELLALSADEQLRQLADGEILVEEGEGTTHRLYVLTEGTLLVLKRDTPITVVTEPGSVVGEMSVLLGVEPSATVRAAGDAQVRVIERPLEFLHEHPDMALAVGRLLAKRLVSVTSYLADIKSQFADRADHLGLVDEVLDALVHDQSADAEPGSARDPDPAY